jgi:Flp pilus assembly protein TadG
MTIAPSTSHAPSDRGSAGVSVVLLTPVVLALLAFAVLAGRVGTAHQDVVSAAQAAARAASLRQLGSAAAATDAREAAATTLRGAGIECASTDIALTSGAGVVTVRVTCQVRLSDLVDLALPGEKAVTAVASAPVDVYRGGA